ncbi:MAG TPA: flagellar motor protein MotB [Burkholderiales bacterium]|nr:flagellar motor protein MotB [Burkholderiales bacterium]
MADNAQRPIVIRRKKKKAGRGHGGAWKIAYADFVTAMMAFFLLMWLLGSTSRGDLTGISEYFQTPLKVAMQGGTGSGDAWHLVKGGGKDITRSEGQLHRGGTPSPRGALSTTTATAATAAAVAAAEESRLEDDKLKELQYRLETAIERNAVLNKYRNQMLIDITSEGLRVQIVDEQNRPMFAVGRAELQPYARDLLMEIGRTLNQVENKVSLAGHTDATPYASGEKGYSNWELSADRANASRRALVAGGMKETHVVRVVGMAAAVALDKNDPLNAMNRRISLIVMNRGAAEAIEKSGVQVQVTPTANAKAPL